MLRYRWVLLGAVLSGCTPEHNTITHGATGRAFAERDRDLPIGNAAKMADGIWRGAQPDAKGLKALRDRGFKTILNLRSYHSERDEAERLGLSVVEISIQADLLGSEPPTERQLRRFFEVLLDPNARPVYFHCAHGADRTGTMAALYRIEVEGWTNDEAVDEMMAFGYHTIYKDLIDFVKTYKRRGFASPKRLLIVAPEAWTAALAPFVRHKRESLPVEIVSLEKALKGEGADDPEKLKRYLYSRRAELSHVLLVGDGDVMPIRFMVLDRVTAPAFDYAFYPSDLYYADLCRADGSFDDWNAAKDGFHGRYFGEVRGEKNKSDAINYDGVDYRPDVALGRWPVSTEAELKTVIEKTIAWEKGEVATKAAFFCIDGWVDVRGQMGDFAAKLPKGWKSEKRLYGQKPAPSEKELLALVNDDVGFAFHAGHGSDWTWDGCLTPDGAKKLKKAAVMMSAGCSTARFSVLPPYEGYVDVDGVEHKGTNHGEVFKEPPPPPAPYQKGAFNPTGLGEQLLRGGSRGAVAYIGCNTGSQPCALTLMEGFVIGLGEKGRLGDAWSRAVAHYFDKEKLATIKPTEDWYPASIFFQGMKFMLFGDPSLRITKY
jgi:protein tyrosine/serine phosphatase